MTSIIKELWVDSLSAKEVIPLPSSNSVMIGGVNFQTDGSLTGNNIPRFQTTNGISHLVVSQISNNGNDIKINDLIITGTSTIHLDVNQQNINVENINPFNQYVYLKGKTVIDDSIIRFKGIGIDADASYNQTAIMEQSYGLNMSELVLFKGKKDVLSTNRIRLDATDSILFQTNSGVRLNPSVGTDRLLIDNTNITSYLPIKVNTITERTGAAGVTIETINLKAGDITGVSNLTMGGVLTAPVIISPTIGLNNTTVSLNNMDIPGVLTVDTINEHTALHGVVIAGITLSGGSMVIPNTVNLGSLAVDAITERSLGAGITIDTMLVKSSVLSILSGEFISLKANTLGEKTLGSGVTIEGMLMKAGNITMSSPASKLVSRNIDLSGSLQTDFIYEYTLNHGVLIDGVLLKDNNVTCDYLITNAMVYTGPTYFDMTRINTIDEWTLDHGVTIEGINIQNQASTLNKFIFNIPTGNIYEFQINSVKKFQILESSIAVDHIYGIDKSEGVKAMNSLAVQELDTHNNLLVMGAQENGVMLSVNGGAYKKDGVGWTTTSDYRIKTDIKNSDIITSFNYIKNIPVKNYKYKEEYSGISLQDAKINIGIIAQDLEKVYDNYYLDKYNSPVKTKKKEVLRIKNNKKGEEEIIYKDFKNFDSGEIIFHLINCVKYIANKMNI